MSARMRREGGSGDDEGGEEVGVRGWEEDDEEMRGKRGMGGGVAEGGG